MTAPNQNNSVCIDLDPINETKKINVTGHADHSSCI